VAGSTYAVLIGVEKYQQASVNDVQFATEDAKAMQDVLVTQMQVPPENILLWIDQQATQHRLRNELPYEINGLGPDDRFIFFYAGHGFYSNGANRLTTWDTHTLDLEGSTTCLDEVLLSPLRKGRCRRSLVFIDACASDITDKESLTRDIFVGMRSEEFADFIASTDYAGAFFSCSPYERSYPSNMLQHGIWTYHLVSALRGEAADAIDRDRRITGESLRNYLAVSVPRFIREKTTMKANQRPYAIIASNGAFEIFHVPEKPSHKGAIPKIDIRFSHSYFRTGETRAYRRLPGFDRRKGHSIPTTRSESAGLWAGRLLHPEMAEELKTVEANAKAVLKLKRRQIRVDIDEANGGTVDTDYFRFSIFADQNPEDPAEVVIDRRIVLRVAFPDLPDSFDTIFPIRASQVILPFSFSATDYDELANSLEEFADENNWEFDESQSDELITLKMPDRGLIISIDASGGEIAISAPGKSGCMALAKAIRTEESEMLTGTVPPLIGSPEL
jgi:hypothetical protein